jgi:hypothetical protein
MRRCMTTIVAVAGLIATAAPAIAQTYPPSQPPAVQGAHGAATGQAGTAFTGGDPTFAIVLTVGLFALGMVALLVARRRAQRLMG